MVLVTDTLRILAVSQLLMVGFYFLLHSRSYLSHLIVLLSICLVAYAVADHSALADNPVTRYLLYRFATATPFLLFVLAFHLFVDSGRIHPLNWGLAAYYMLVRIIGIPFYDPEMNFSTLMFILIYVIPQLLILYFSVLAVFLAARGYPVDLVEERRRFRVYFVAGVGVLLALRTINGFLSFTDPFLDSFSLFSLPPVPDYLLTAYLFLLSLVFNLAVFRLHQDAFKLIQTAESVSPPSAGEQELVTQIRNGANAVLIQRIIDKMEKDRLYARAGLTIAELAKETSIQEYRLRRLINKELQFRNFNQFLNHYRIREASQRLLETGNAVSYIALDIGYSSLSSFNSAFKATFGMTPTEYRQAKDPVSRSIANTLGKATVSL